MISALMFLIALAKWTMFVLLLIVAAPAIILDRIFNYLLTKLQDAEENLKQ